MRSGLARIINLNNYVHRIPKITPHACRHTHCFNMVRSEINLKTLQYFMGHLDITVTMNVYTVIGFDVAEVALKWMERLEATRKVLDRTKEKQPVS